MIVNPQHLALDQPWDAAVCIVGAGAAGITLACELDGMGLPVLLLDAGAVAEHEVASQDPYAGSSEGLHPAPHFFRRRGFGGTTAIWGGRCVPYDPIDFETRPFVPDSGWPIRYEELARHYPKAMTYCDAGDFEFDARRAFASAGEAIAGMGDSPDLLSGTIERYSLPTDFGKRYRSRLAVSRNVSVLGQAQVLRLQRAPHAGRIEALQARIGENGPVLTVRARVFILATGGIETPRLLLASDPEGPGLGNTSDCVGRYYACHIENAIGVLRPARAGSAFDFETTRDGVYARRKLLFTPEAQRREGLLNMSFRLHYPDVSDAHHRSAVLSAVYLAKRTLIPEYRRILQHGRVDGAPVPLAPHLRNVAVGLPRLAHFGVDWLRRRTLARRKLPYVLVPNADGSYVLEFNAEQTPLRESRIVLTGNLDGFGVPRVHVGWRRAEQDVDSICRAYHLLRKRLHESGAATLTFDDGTLWEQVAASRPLGGHHIGTTRMAAHAKDGVVDGNAAVFDFPNLFIASASVFPTSSHANPTLTIVAMAIRLAAHVRALQAQEGLG